MAGDSDPRAAPAPGRHFVAFVLLALASAGPSHPPAIAHWLARSLPGGMRPDLPTLYRTLQALEREGAVRSTWATGRGPARHVYALTPAGWEELRARADDVRRSRDNLDFFLAQLERLGENGGLMHG
ncbi:MAG: PadR family transcriptional regulator [Actinomycetia bacterium]|nr:PadR family transcriptional regulator [Actinomycetes bacterium]